MLFYQNMFKISHNTLQPLVCFTLATSIPLCSSPWQRSHSLDISTSCGLKCDPASYLSLHGMNFHNLVFTGALILPNKDGQNSDDLITEEPMLFTVCIFLVFCISMKYVTLPRFDEPHQVLDQICSKFCMMLFLDQEINLDTPSIN